MNNTIAIAFAFDDNLLMPASVCISSLLQNANPDTFYDIFILHAADALKSREMLDILPLHYGNCKLQYRMVGNCFEKAFEIRGITVAAYYRLLIPELIPEYEKVIYADVDMIFRQDLSNVYSMDLGNNYIAATYDWGLNISEEGKAYIDSVKGLQNGRYIQSGFIILNSIQIRKDNLIEMFRSLAKRKLRYQDQDILNIACRGRIKILPFSYNMTDSVFYYIEKGDNHIPQSYRNAELEEARSIGTLHFNGAKPWMRYCVNFDLWWEYYRKCPVYDRKFHFDFFYDKLDEYDRLPLIKRVKILIRYFFCRK